MKGGSRRQRIIRDALIVVLSVLFAFAIAQSSLIDLALSTSGPLYILQSFVAGLFFTSVFTTAPAIAILAKLGTGHPVMTVAMIGALGSLMGDLIIFMFVRTRVSSDVAYLLSKAKSRRFRHLLDRPFARLSLGFLGALVIASPLPDELGVGLLGLSGIKARLFAPVSYVFNAIGIALIVLIARSF
jgi:hypothetical protein